jgi:NAD(P)-dependent dehydrogenase (short-subunit alcohol dehydrogenase family)
VEESASTRRELDGKVALIFGAGGGIGSAAATLFAREGAHVAAADVNGAAAAQVAQEISGRAPGRAVALEADVADPVSVQRAFQETIITFGGVDVVFYSPGVAPELHGVDEMPEPEAERQMRVHYLGAVTVTREAARAMIAQGTGGRLIYNASKAALAPGEGAGHYGASKAALVHYVRNVANELGRHKITANYINADAIDTPLFRSFVRQRAAQRGESEEQTLARYAERSVLREALVPPEAVAEAALWLASGRAGHTTGCVITVGGGAEGFPR